MDFRKKMRRRLYSAIGYIALGLIMMLCYWLSKSPNVFINSFGFALIVVGIVRIRNYLLITKNEQTLRRQEIAETDERNIMLAHRARSLAFVFYNLLAGTLVIILSLLGIHQPAQWIAYSVCALLFIYLLTYYIIRRQH